MSHRSLPNSIGRRAQWIVDELEAREVTVHPSSRLGVYARRFAANDYLVSGYASQERICEALMALRDIHEIVAILLAFPAGHEAELQDLVQDAALPRTDRSTPGRDRQAELFVGATCQQGNMDVLLDREPDLWCNVDGVHIGLAVKRVRSANKFVNNLRDGADQIQRSQLCFGFICIDTTLAWNRDICAIITDRPPADVALDYRERLDRFLDSHEEALDCLMRDFPKTLGILCVDQVFSLHPTDGWCGDQLSVFYLSARNNRHRVRIASAFQSGWMRGSPDCVNLNAQQRTGRFRDPPTDRVIRMRPNT